MDFQPYYRIVLERPCERLLNYSIIVIFFDVLINEIVLFTRI